MFRSVFAQTARRFATAAEPRITDAGRKILAEEAAIGKASEANAQLWIKITWFVGLPTLLISGVHAYKLFKEHQEHLEHEGIKFEPYPYMRIRNKRFFWGDGDHTAFFNPRVNPEPEE